MDGDAGLMPLFERYVMVDWSAAAVPTTGKDSIWIATVRAGTSDADLCNPSTRSEAVAIIREAIASTDRVLVGFDFAFGYPEGTAMPFGGTWVDVWEWLAAEAVDADDNANDRFELAGRFNARFDCPEGPLWGHPPGRCYANLSPTKPAAGDLPDRRRVERIVRNAQPTGKLAYPGSVGSQTLLGIARLERLRRSEDLATRIRIWPFETGFATDLSSVVIAEIFPSLHGVVRKPNEVRDAAQVRTLAEGYARLDRIGSLTAHLAGPSDPATRDLAIREEGWIMSVADEPMRLAA